MNIVYKLMKRFNDFLSKKVLNEAGPMPGGPPPMGGMPPGLSGPASLPGGGGPPGLGGPPLGGGMPPPMGGLGGGPPPMGGGMPPGGQPQQTPPIKVQAPDVWHVLEKILGKDKVA